ncbi:hypothetical protein BHM03_00014944 [Ensete ventricosum]|nr:hypothetical protein BHM03_00014944 [Ensete ventricosum]
MPSPLPFLSHKEDRLLPCLQILVLSSPIPVLSDACSPLKQDLTAPPFSLPPPLPLLLSPSYVAYSPCNHAAFMSLMLPSSPPAHSSVVAALLFI